MVREGNASVVKIFTGEPFTAIPLGGSTGVFYIAARLESPFVFQSPLVSSENFSPYVSPVGASVVGLFPYGDVAVNVSTGVIQGWFTKPCDTSPLPIVTYILREETQLAAEVTDEDVANVTISANFTVYFQGYNREGVVGKGEFVTLYIVYYLPYAARDFAGFGSFCAWTYSSKAFYLFIYL